MLLCARIVLGAKSPYVIFPRTSARKDYAHEAHTFGGNLAMDHFFPEFVVGAKCLWIIWPRVLFPTFQVHVEKIFSDEKLEKNHPKRKLLQ